MASKEEKLAYLRNTPGGASSKHGATASGLSAGAQPSGDGEGAEIAAPVMEKSTPGAATGGSKAAGQSTPDQKLFEELDRLEKELARLKKQFAPGGISKDEQAKLDAVQAKIDSIVKKLTADGQVIDVSAAPPSRPSDLEGEIEYQGIPLDKLKDPRQQNIARENARTVREGVKSIDGWAKRLDEKSRAHTQKQLKYETVTSRSEDVNAAFSKDLNNGGITTLSRAVGPMFEQTLANYEQAAVDVEISLSALRA